MNNWNQNALKVFEECLNYKDKINLSIRDHDVREIILAGEPYKKTVSVLESEVTNYPQFKIKLYIVTCNYKSSIRFLLEDTTNTSKHISWISEPEETHNFCNTYKITDYGKNIMFILKKLLINNTLFLCDDCDSLGAVNYGEVGYICDDCCCHGYIG
jgi:hypothetical protein